ncbi:MAG: PVC-type heme-binding CxxCH protein [Planctomycetota bacterium]|jgi:putative membrane-bound dehydrogenase-like protein
MRLFLVPHATFLALAIGLISACPAPSSAQPGAEAPSVLFMIGEREYKTDRTLPVFAKERLEPLGITGTFVFADKDDPNFFPGLDTLPEHDVLFISVRRRTIRAEQMRLIRDHLAAGKGLIGIRTASHAFALREGEAPAGHVQWKDFDREVLGGVYNNHYRNKGGTPVATASKASLNEILWGVRSNAFRSGGTLYKSTLVSGSANELLRGMTLDEGNPIQMPVAWTHTHNKSRVFYTSLGHEKDFEAELFTTMLANAVFWVNRQPNPRATGRISEERNRFDLSVAGNEKIQEMMTNWQHSGELGDDSLPTPPGDALDLFLVNEDLELELVANEPTVMQPLFVDFDERGRMWVVQYLQYPFPAGLKVIEYDNWLRAVFDKVPPPPPNHFEGRDKISVLEDTDGDGRFDTAKDVITGLNITSSVAIGRGGVWVLNPPYLMFYPDADRDDIPDGDPEVHLAGFGLQDTHSVSNSLMWGPDGWLYGANGSTTVGTVSSAATRDVHFKGQCIWRYHPESKVFEIFAEGGGNTFSLDFDEKGRAFSGTNNGKTRGMHYVQGGYAKKNWGKHGPLTNPYAFGYYQHMRHDGRPERFTQTFLIYDDTKFPERYQHQVVAANSLHNMVLASTLSPDTSTYQTKDFPPVVISQDRWFRPVHVKQGPDGGVYIADWYDSRLNHVDPRDNWHKKSGRVYRLKAKDAKPLAPFDLGKRSTDELIDVLTTHDSKWFRHTALRLLGDRKDRSAIPRLSEIALRSRSERRVDALWGLNLSGGFTDVVALEALDSDDEHVRRWAVRLLGDRREASPALAYKMAELARTESRAQVRSQLASTAKRLPAADALPIVRNLLARSEDNEDLHIPLLLWWALEAQATDHDAVASMFSEAELWSLPMADRHILERLMQRYAMSGEPDDLTMCARLLELAPNEKATQRLMTGLQAAFQGRPIDNLPPALAAALVRHQESLGQNAVVLGLRLGDRDAFNKAIQLATSTSADKAQRLAIIQTLGQIENDRAVPTLIKLMGTVGDPVINRVSLEALANYPDPKIADAILGKYGSSIIDAEGVRATAHRVLASRKAWALKFLAKIDAWVIKSETIPFDIVQQMKLHGDEEIDSLITRIWGKVNTATAAQHAEQIARIRRVLSAGTGDAAAGKPLYTALCSRCHVLFDEGGQAGPELTGYERDNLDFMLTAIVNPNAAIREEYTNFVATTKDGQALIGLIIQQDTRTVTLQGVDAQITLINRDNLESLRALETTVMPEGLVTGLTDQQLRDLFSYLMSPTPVR